MARQILDEGVEGGAQVGGREGLPNASLEVEKGSESGCDHASNHQGAQQIDHRDQVHQGGRVR